MLPLTPQSALAFVALLFVLLSFVPRLSVPWQIPVLVLALALLLAR